MATGPVDADHPTSTEYDALARRCADAEATVQRLEAELAEARSRIEQLEASVAPEPPVAPLSLFEGGEDTGGSLVGDGSDPRVLSVILGATAVVAGMVSLLALINGTLFTPFGIVMVLLTIGLAWAALNTRVTPVEVSVVRGMVMVDQGESSYRFDLRSPATAVEMVGRPGEAGWQVRFPRRGMEPFVIDAGMVDPHDFVRQLREYRPDLG